MRNIAALVIAGAILAGCASTHVTQLSRNQALVDVEAAPACGSNGAAKVAERQTAIATIKQGYERYIIAGANADNNVSTTFVPTGSTTTGAAYGMGNMATFQGNTNYTYMPMMMGRYRAQLRVIMFNKDDAGYDQAIDARTVLGPEWQKLVAEGITTCN